MEWSGTETGKPRLGVRWMALALIVAAFLGGGLGLVWQSAGFGDDEADSADSPADAAEAE
jgi:hypothetical protein